MIKMFRRSAGGNKLPWDFGLLASDTVWSFIGYRHFGSPKSEPSPQWKRQTLYTGWRLQMNRKYATFIAWNSFLFYDNSYFTRRRKISFSYNFRNYTPNHKAQNLISLNETRGFMRVVRVTGPCWCYTAVTEQSPLKVRQQRHSLRTAWQNSSTKSKKKNVNWMKR
jgi:hypothetical protein